MTLRGHNQYAKTAIERALDLAVLQRELVDGTRGMSGVELTSPDASARRLSRNLSEPIEPSNRKVRGERSRCHRRTRSAADHVNLCLELQGAAAGDRHLNAGGERSARPPDARLFDPEREQPSSGEHVSARRTSAALASDEGEDLSGLDVSEGKALVLHRPVRSRDLDAAAPGSGDGQVDPTTEVKSWPIVDGAALDRLERASRQLEQGCQ